MTARLEGDALRARVDALDWHHQIDLGNGLVTPGQDPSAAKEAALRLPSLRGKSVLDIGAWNGYFSFAAERLGASRVVALDSFAWGGAEWGTQDTFNLAREALGSKVEDVYCEVLDISPEKVGRFDVVFFLGVLYHMRDPFLALEHAASVCDELLVVETLIDMTFTRRPAAAFYPHADMDGDDTNWWGPNTPAVVGMLENLGFSRIEVVNAPSPAQRLRRIAARVRRIVRDRRAGWRYAFTDRVIIHAYR